MRQRGWEGWGLVKRGGRKDLGDDRDKIIRAMRQGE